VGYGAEDDAIDRAHGLEHVVGKGGSDSVEGGQADWFRLAVELQSELVVRRLEHGEGRVGDLWPDAVAWEYEQLHAMTSLWWVSRLAMTLTWLPGTTSRLAAARQVAKWGAAR